MATSARIPIGAPGLYRTPDLPLRAVTGVRMDVCAFVGVAPRGPVWVPMVNELFGNGGPCVQAERPRRRSLPVAVESFDEYQQLYGAFEGPGLLPYAVAAFFEQGGRRAYIVRIVHDYTADPIPDAAANDAGVASGDLPGASSPAGALTLRARSEGSWGNRLRAALTFTLRPLLFDSAKASLTGIELPSGMVVPAGALLRLNQPGGKREFRFVDAVLELPQAHKPGLVFTARFDSAATELPVSAEIVEAVLAIDDSAGRTERHERLGLSLLHPRWMAMVLCNESQLVYPDASWAFDRLTPDGTGFVSDPPASALFSGGEDRYADITPEDFFDPLWTIGDEEPGSGIHSLTNLTDLALVVAPDLYSPKPLVEPRTLEDPVSLAGPSFTCCVTPPARAVQPETVEPDLVKLRLDPKVPADLDQITTLQHRLVDFAEQLHSFVVLLDVPPGLTERRILNWRNRFDSSYAAAYHPWLFVSRRDDSRDARVLLPPAAAAAGIIAQVEHASGVPHGPANVIAAEVIDVDDRVSPARHDELHPLGINIYLSERDGIRLTAARTLSADPAFRQLSVRRLMVLIRRTVEQQMQWAVFEPNNAALRAEIRQLLNMVLRQLFLAGAFRGATEEQSFFVRCDDANNPPRLADAGQFLVEIGVAPSEPLEFIVLRISRDGDGTLNITEAGG
jgi:uncharacterized protein